MSDKEHTPASLGHSKILRVLNDPRCFSAGSNNQTRVCPLLLSARNEGGIVSHQRSEEASEGVIIC